MPVDYSGLTRNTWPGTWSPTGAAPIALDTELRGGLQSISGGAGDKLTDIYGQRISEGMMVFLKNGYVASGYTRTSSTYYTYALLPGESRSQISGAMPNAEANWSEISFASGGGGTGSGVTSFLALTDTPNSYVGAAGYVVTVNSSSSGLEFSPANTVLYNLDGGYADSIYGGITNFDAGYV